jgi:hypothetical protein
VSLLIFTLKVSITGVLTSFSSLSYMENVLDSTSAFSSCFTDFNHSVCTVPWGNRRMSKRVFGVGSHDKALVAGCNGVGWASTVQASASSSSLQQIAHPTTVDTAELVYFGLGRLILVEHRDLALKLTINGVSGSGVPVQVLHHCHRRLPRILGRQHYHHQLGP